MGADRFDAFPASLATAPSRRAAMRVLAGLGLAGLFGQTDAKKKKKKKKKKCARAGQTTSKKRKKCCAGLARDDSGVCGQPPSSPPSSCTPAACAPNACGNVPDGCGGMLNCGGCAGEAICANRVCQPCTVICTASPPECGTVLQAAMAPGGTIYACPGRYQATFGASTSITVIGAGAGDDPASNTILDAAGTGTRVWEINTGPVELQRLHLTGGQASIAGGGILLRGGSTLRMTECTVSGNLVQTGTGTGRGGGGIQAQVGTTLEMTRCTVRNNHSSGSPGRGGGILTFGTTTLTDCLIDENSADLSAGDHGGGLYVAGGTTSLAGTTQVRDNAADLGGGIFVESGTLVIAETCRVTENRAAAMDDGGGIYNGGGMVTLQGAPGTTSPIVVNNCHENCAPSGSVAGCSPDLPVLPCT